MLSCENKEKKNIKRYGLDGLDIYLSVLRTDEEAVKKYIEWQSDQTTSIFRDDEFHVLDTTKMPGWCRGEDRTRERFGIVEAESDTLIGYCHIDKSADDMAAWVSVNIGDKSMRGKGYGKQVIFLMMHRIFLELGFESIHLDVHEKNLPAIRCYEKLGFRTSGVYRHHCYANREYTNWLHMDILSSEFADGIGKTWVLEDGKVSWSNYWDENNAAAGTMECYKGNKDGNAAEQQVKARKFRPAAVPGLKNIGTEKFSYIYKEEEIVYGHKAVHLGEGIYMFEDPIMVEEDAETLRGDLRNQYPDLIFFYSSLGSDNAFLEKDYILFVISGKYRIHTERLAGICPGRKESGRLCIPASVLGVWEWFAGWNGTEIDVREFAGGSERFMDDSPQVTDGSKDSGLLRYEFDPDRIEEYNGYKKYMIVDGFIGTLIDEGIYYFDLPSENSIGRYVYSGGSEKFGCLPSEQAGRQFEGASGLLLNEEGCGRIMGEYCTMNYYTRYLSVGESAADRLYRLGNLLGEYRFERCGGRKPQKCLDSTVDSSFEVQENRLKQIIEKTAFHIEEDAVELVEGAGISNLTVILCPLLHDKRFVKECDYAYVHGDDLILVINGLEHQVIKYTIPMAALSKLSVKLERRLFGITTGSMEVPVIQKGSMEEFARQELYKKYKEIYKILEETGIDALLGCI